MSTQLWFHLAHVLDLAEHALTATEHRRDPAGTGQAGPALVCIVGDGVRLASTGTQPSPPMPAFADGHPHGTDHRHRAANGNHLPDGGTFLPLTVATTGRESLADRLRAAAATGQEWLSLDLTTPQPVVEFHTHRPRPLASTVEWVPALVAIDDLIGPYPAQVQAQYRWNGWAIPRFSIDVAHRIAEDTQRLAAGCVPGVVEVVRVAGDRVEIIRNPDAGGGDVEGVGPDRDGLYWIGAMAWTWSIVDEAATECLEECRCGSGCGCPDGCAVCDEPVDAGHQPNCPWSAGSAPYEEPEIPAQPAVLDAHRHRPGCRMARRGPGPLFIPEGDADRCGFCGHIGGLDAHTVRTSGGGVEHHQRCTNCGETWSAVGPASTA